MAGGKERAFLARLLRESVLTLCREAMDSHRRFIVDGIVCISLEDDNSGDDCNPIVVTIHEQLPKLCNGGYSPSPQHQTSPSCDAAATLACSRPAGEEMEEDRAKKPDKPLDKKNNILRRVQQAEAKKTAVNSIHSPAPHLTSPCRSVSEPPRAKMPRLQEEKEEAMDGHVSDPTPHTYHPLTPHSPSQYSQGSERGEECRESMSSPASSDLSSSPHDDVSMVGRAGSASPQDDCGLPVPVTGFASPALLLSRFSGGRLGSHTRRHFLCSTPFTTKSALNHQVCLNTHRAGRRSNSHMILSRRSSKQRYMPMSQPRIRRRVNERCNFCPYVGRRQGDLKKHLLTHLNYLGNTASRAFTHSSRKGFYCSSCAITFGDPVTYTAHVKCHSQDPDFQQYRCCYCTAVLQNYEAFTIHQQVHALQQQQQPAYDFWQYPRHFREVAHLPEHLSTHARGPGDSARKSQTEDGHLQGSGREQVEKNHIKHGESEAEQQGAKEDVDEAEGKDSRSGPRQSWCTECQLGFSDEETLLSHITETHEAFIGRFQQDQLAHRASPPDAEGFRNDPTDTVNTAVEHLSSDEDRSENRADGENTDHGESEDKHTPSERCFTNPESTADKTSRKARTTETEGPLQSYLSHSEVLGRRDSEQSSVDADCASADLLRTVDPIMMSRLRVVQLPELKPKNYLPGSNREADVKTGSLITLVKPKDLIIATDSLPRSTTSPVRFQSTAPMPVLDLTTTHKRSGTDTAYSLLGGSLNSRSHFHAAEQKTSIKQEPESDPGKASLCEALRSPLRMILPCDRDSMSYGLIESSRHSPDLPQNLSMPRASSTSPRSATVDSVRSPGFEKVVTPEVPFCERAPLECPMQDCGQEFPSFSDLEEHSARVHRRYLCSYCGNRFTAKPNRDRHVRMHTGVKPYKCQLCKQAFHRGDDLKYHVTTKHPRPDTEY